MPHPPGPVLHHQSSFSTPNKTKANNTEGEEYGFGMQFQVQSNNFYQHHQHPQQHRPQQHQQQHPQQTQQHHPQQHPQQPQQHHPQQLYGVRGGGGGGHYPTQQYPQPQQHPQQHHPQQQPQQHP